MINLDSQSVLNTTTSSFTDFTDLQRIRKQGNTDQDAALEEVAKQFESILMQTMLKTMREANAVFEEGGMFNSSEMKFHRDMYDNQLALNLSSGKGIGIADALIRQLKQQYGEKTAAELNQNLGELDKTFQIKDYAKQVSAIGMKVPAADSPASFVEQIAPYAKEAARELGVDPRVLIAQAALETGWGKHVIHDTRGDNSFNLFNIKADSRWQGDSVQVRTLEYRNGLPKPEVASFRRYESFGQSFADYVDFLQSNPRYKEALKATDNPESYVQELQNAGYATDPSYAKKITDIFNGKHLSLARL
jgi:flagellar protein FlgJ